MTESNEGGAAGEQLSTGASITRFLKPDEARILTDWARTEEAATADAASTDRVRAIAREIDDLVGHRTELVADDLEERMIALLVGHLDPKSQINLEISREVAQVTAEKDHLEVAELVRRLTQISSHTLRLTDGAPSTAAAPPTITESPMPAATTPIASLAGVPATAALAARARPIPRPTKYPPHKPGFLQRLLGRRS